MSLKAKRKPANNIPPLDGGTYMSVCVGVIDLGEQYRQGSPPRVRGKEY